MTTNRTGPSDPIATTVWVRDARRQRAAAGSEPPLSRAQIVSAAIGLLDAEGLAGLSMRRLGAALGSGATSLYWYVANKDELLDLALDEVMAEVATPEVTAGEWRDALAEFARSLRTTIVRHSWLTRVMGMRPTIGPRWTHLSDWMLDVLTGAGFSGADAGYAGSGVSSYALGAAMADAAYHESKERTGLSGGDLMAMMAEYMETHAGTHPHLDKWLRENLPDDVDQMRENTFEFGLQRQLDGLAAWLDRPGG